MKKAFFYFLLAIFALPYQNMAQNTLKIKNIATGLDTPWEILWGPDNSIWVTERFGRISKINPSNGEIKNLLTIPDAKESGEGGLLGMALDPDFAQNTFVYVAYNYLVGTVYKEKIVRYTYAVTSEKLESPKIIFDNIDASNNHNGCRIIISPDKKMFFTTGDAQITSNSQSPKNINGKILRINLDGTIPADNPIANSPVWSWGHRNAQGLVFSPDGKILYSSEHGANSDDELNIIKKGRNYGWPKVEGFCDNALETAFCKDSNVIEPIHSWTPTLGVAGTSFYGADLIPSWKNSLLVTSLKGARISQLLLDSKGEKVLKVNDFYTNTYGRLRDICISPDGKVYIAISNKDGRGFPKADDDKIIEISPASTAIVETSDKELISISPNPSNDFVNVYFSNSNDIGFHYSIVNSEGSVCKKGQSIVNSFQLNVTDLSNGLYVLLVWKNNKVYSNKVLIMK
jgi:aldose sugar dehydrogenase